MHHTLFALVIFLGLAAEAGIGRPVFAEKRDAIFEQLYETGYRAGQCGKNVENLLQKWSSAGTNMQNYALVRIVNRGSSAFGMVSAERARSMVRNQRAEAQLRWYHHVIAVDAQGFTYDFDFTTQPRSVLFSYYVHQMFLHQPACKNPGLGHGAFVICVKPEDKLSGYQLEWFRADQVLANQNPKPFFVGTLKQSLAKAEQMLRWRW